MVWTIVPSGFKSSSVFIGQLVVTVGSSAIVSSVISWIVLVGRLGCFSVIVVIAVVVVIVVVVVVVIVVEVVVVVDVVVSILSNKMFFKRSFKAIK